MGKHEPLTSKERAARYRAAQKAKGLRLKRMWVPDLRDPQVLERIERASIAIAASPTEEEDQAWVEAVMAPVWDHDDDERE